MPAGRQRLERRADRRARRVHEDARRGGARVAARAEDADPPTGSGAASRAGYDDRPQADRDPLHRHVRCSSSSPAGSWPCSSGRSSRTPNEHVVTEDAYNELFTMHGTTMVFLVVVPILAGFGNFLVPLMIGARDMAFPRLNALSYWLFLFGGIVLLCSASSRRAARRTRGWTAYPPLSKLYTPGNGQDLWILGAAHLLDLVARRRDQLRRHDPEHAHGRDVVDAACRSSSGRSRRTRCCSSLVLPALSAG